MGREWIEATGNLYCSTIVRLRAADPPAHMLAFVAGIAAYEAVSKHVPPNEALRIKWPNDLLWDGAKLCGILLERSRDAVVVGFGVNVTDHPEIAGRSVTDLAAIGATGDAAALLIDLAVTFEYWLGVWRVEGARSIIIAWSQRALPPGTPVSVSIPDGTSMAGDFAGLQDDGALILRLANGATRVIHTGDVFLL